LSEREIYREMEMVGSFDGERDRQRERGILGPLRERESEGENIFSLERERERVRERKRERWREMFGSF